MRNRISILILFNLIYFTSYSQFRKLILKNIDTDRRVCIKKNHHITIYVDTIKYMGEISNIGNDFFEIRIYGRNPNKMEFDSVSSRDSHYDKHIRQGWYCKSEPYSHTDNFIRVFYRSTDIEKITFGKINYFEYRKSENINGAGIELLFASIGLITSPIWLCCADKPNWTMFFVCAGIVTLDFTVMLVKNQRHKLRAYNFSDWKIKKTK